MVNIWWGKVVIMWHVQARKTCQDCVVPQYWILFRNYSSYVNSYPAHTPIALAWQIPSQSNISFQGLSDSWDEHSFNKIEVTGVQSSLVVFLDMQVVAVNLNSTSDANIVVLVSDESKTTNIRTIVWGKSDPFNIEIVVFWVVLVLFLL